MNKKPKLLFMLKKRKTEYFAHVIRGNRYE